MALPHVYSEESLEGHENCFVVHPIQFGWTGANFYCLSAEVAKESIQIDGRDYSNRLTVSLILGVDVRNDLQPDRLERLW